MVFTMLPFWSALIANVIAQSIKPIITYLQTNEFNAKQAFASGGFPSSHTSTVFALALAVGINEGFDSTMFSIALAFALIVMYDAVNVRYYAGKNIELTKKLIQDLSEKNIFDSENPIYDEKLKDVLGHKKIEAVGGLVLGCLVTLVLYFMTGG